MSRADVAGRVAGASKRQGRRRQQRRAGPTAKRPGTKGLLAANYFEVDGGRGRRSVGADGEGEGDNDGTKRGHFDLECGCGSARSLREGGGARARRALAWPPHSSMSEGWSAQWRAAWAAARSQSLRVSHAACGARRRHPRPSSRTGRRRRSEAGSCRLPRAPRASTSTGGPSGPGARPRLRERRMTWLLRRPRWHGRSRWDRARFPAARAGRTE